MDETQTQKENKNNSGSVIEPRIYVASLADYNAGRLLGEWIDANQDAEAIHKAIEALLATSKEEIAEEWAIHDYEGFGPLSIREYESIEKVAEAAKLIAEHGEVVAHLIDHMGGLEYIETARRKMEESYCGEYESVEDYACQSMEEIYSEPLKALPDIIRLCIDWDRVANDLEIGGDIIVLNVDYRRVHVFYAND